MKANEKRIVESAGSPNENDLWLNGTTLKKHENGEWKQIAGGGGGTPSARVQADWSQTDDTKPDYIKNKPEIPSGGGSTVHEFDVAFEYDEGIGEYAFTISDEVKSAVRELVSDGDYNIMFNALMEGGYEYRFVPVSWYCNSDSNIVRAVVVDYDFNHYRLFFD